jgi:hypothetical protein
MKATLMVGMKEGRVRQVLKTASAAILAAGLFAGAATAAPIPSQGSLGDVVKAQDSVELAQFVFGGRNYCWYGDGWQGPGYYWCGYAWRRGFGWGGGAGWHGWGAGGRGGFHGGGRGGFHGGGRGGFHGGGHGGGHGGHR